MTRLDIAKRHALHGLAEFINITRHIILQQHALAVTMRGIGNRNRRNKLAGVRVLRVLEHCPSRPHLHDLPHQHRRHAMANALDHTPIVQDKKARTAPIPLTTQP